LIMHKKSPELPIRLRAETWKEIQELLGGYQLSSLRMLGYQGSSRSAVARQVADNAGPLVADLPRSGVRSLLANTVIRLANEVEYVVSDQAAQQFAQSMPTINVRALGGREEPHELSEIDWALRFGGVFDQLESNETS